jgi:hypothetical protein
LRFRNIAAASFLSALTVAASGCDRGGAVRSGPSVTLESVGGSGGPIVVATGLSDAALDPAVRCVDGASDCAAFVVTVQEGDSTPIAGTYRMKGGRIEFHPRFPLDPGRTYHARLVLRDTTLRTALTVAGERHEATTVVVRAYPSDTVPENLLRLYLEFSDSMSRESGVAHVHLLDDAGREVEHAFLPLEGDFWNPAHTRYTVFFDPGRVKRGILPNEQMGRALRAGNTYTLVVDSAWHDAHGQPLARPFRQRLVATTAVLAPITLSEWRIDAPRAGTTEPVLVGFPRPLDRALLDRAVGVETNEGKPVEGSVTIAPGERRWTFTPRAPWSNAPYRLVVLTLLEDVAGNQVDHAFEVDLFERVDSTARAERRTVEFTPRR